MRPRGRLVAGVVVSTALSAVAPSPSHAARTPITGRLGNGYTVIALAANGNAGTAVVRRGSFRVRPPAGTVTLHLRSRSGSYAGPIVVARAGRRAIEGIRAGARLGRITVDARRGYAKVVRRVAARWVDRSRWARAVDGVPIGAHRFGRVRSRPPRHPPAGDLDADGVANPLDVDDDGDLVLDDVDRRRGGRAVASQAQAGGLGAFTLLYELGNSTYPPNGPRTQPVNVNAGMAPADIETALAQEGKLSINADTPDHEYVSGELDCGGLTYCSAGGSGVHEPPGGNSVDPAAGAAPFPACCDRDRNGLGAFDSTAGALGLFLQPHAASDAIRGGDVLIMRAKCSRPCGPDGSTRRELAGALASVFATVPAIASYTDELGATHVLDYPLTPWGPAFPMTDSMGSEIAVVDGPDPGSDVSVKLTFWRPQRRALPAEVSAGQGDWIDMGGLIQFAHTLGRSATTWCPADAYSGVEGGLVPSELPIPSDLGPLSAPVFIDSATDQPSSPGHVFSYTLNVTECLHARGHEFDAGARTALVFDAMLPPVPNQPVNFAESGYSFYHQPEGP